MRALEILGKAIGYVLLLLVFVALTAVDIYILLNYGLIVFLVATPIAMAIFWLLMMAVSAIVFGAISGIAWLINGVRRR